MPLAFSVRHAYLGAPDNRMLRMPTDLYVVTTSDQRDNEPDVDCSGRSLATLLVAWVGAAMVASVLLRWKYMWIALTILTMVFLLACGYAACNARRAQERIIRNEEERILEGRRTVNIQSVSGSVDNFPEPPEPPPYDTYWTTDLPPPYAVVIGAEQPAANPRRGSEPESSGCPGDGPRISNPPPYSVAIQSAEANVFQTTATGLGNRVETAQTMPSQDRSRPIIDQPSNSQRDRALGADRLAWDDDKIPNEQSAPNPQTVRPNATTTQYLSNIISCTFGIGQRRNTERNSSTTSPERGDVFQPSSGLVLSHPSSSANRISATAL